MTCKNSTLTQSRLKELLHYNPETGVFTWIAGKGAKKSGEEAGTISCGYISICIDYEKHCAHRLAFLYMTGCFPKQQVDHRNRITDDNRWRNIRDVSPRINHENRIDNNDFIGVSWFKQYNQWQVKGSAESGRKFIGYFKTHLAACYARHAYDIGALS